MPSTVGQPAGEVTRITAGAYDEAMTMSLARLRSVVRDHSLRAVVSDLDGVLRVFDPGLWAELDEIAGTAPGSSFAAVLGHPYLDEVVRGRGTHRRWRELAAAELVRAGADAEAAATAIRAWLASSARVDREILAELEALRATGLGVFVLTNGTDRVPLELEELGLLPFLGEGRRFLLNTADLGAAKPDPEAFARAHARIEQELGTTLDPASIGFLDDSPRHVRGAERFGWRAVLHTASDRP